MNSQELMSILRAPHSTEKASLNAGDCPQYVFRVAMHANKQDVKRAVEHVFKVTVRSVNMLRVKGGYASRSGRRVGKYSSWKKAYVVLEAGQEISFA